MCTGSKFTVLAAAGCLTASLAVMPVGAAEITVVASAGPLPNVMSAVIALFERATGHKVNISFKSAPAIIADVKQGAADLVVTTAEVVDDLGKNGDVSPGSKTLLMISDLWRCADPPAVYYPLPLLVAPKGPEKATR